MMRKIGTRIDLPTKYPFWSAIILQQHGSISVPAGSNGIIYIQPPENETWFVWIDGVLYSTTNGSGAGYTDYDGTTYNVHVTTQIGGTYGFLFPYIHVCKILTNSLYARIVGYNTDSVPHYFHYGYSGFKLSRPLWKTKKMQNSVVWKRKLTVSLPTEIEGLEKYAAEIYDHQTRSYVPVVFLEKDTPLAVDEKTNFPVERATVYIPVDRLQALWSKIPVDKDNKMGFKKYYEKWKAEGLI